MRNREPITVQVRARQFFDPGERLGLDVAKFSEVNFWPGCQLAASECCERDRAGTPGIQTACRSGSALGRNGERPGHGSLDVGTHILGRNPSLRSGTSHMHQIDTELA